MERTRGNHLYMTRSRAMGASFPLAFAAGIGAGAVAGLVNVGLLMLLHAHIPPVVATGWSSVVAGALGGLVYAMWSRISPRPVAALWLTSLLVATIDTIVVFALPFPATGRHIGLAPLSGIVTPLLQILALFGIGGSSRGHLPTSFRGIYLEVHYITAVMVSLLIPVFARPKSG